MSDGQFEGHTKGLCLEPSAGVYAFMDDRWRCSMPEGHDPAKTPHVAFEVHDPMRGIRWLGPWKDGTPGYTRELTPLAGIEDQSHPEFGRFMETALKEPAVRAAYDDASLRHRLVAELVAHRKAQGLSQVDVATRLGVSQATVSEAEAGPGSDAGPRLSSLQRYARAVGCKLVVSVDAMHWAGEGDESSE